MYTQYSAKPTSAIATSESARAIDGAYACEPGRLAPRFHAAAPLADEQVAQLARTLQRRVTRYLQRQGRRPREHGAADDSATEPDLLERMSAASVRGRGALATESRPPVERVGRRREVRPLFVPGSLCCDYGGFSLHAKD